MQEVVVLFDSFRDPLLRYLLSLGLRLQDGEEVIQEVFLALFQHLSGGKPRDNLRGWLFRVAHNIGLKRQYRASREMQIFAASGEEDLAVDPCLNPEQRLASSRTHRQLLAVVNALPERDRQCLSLRAEGLTYREIAQVLEVSLGLVSLMLTRCLARIARFVEM